jgi:hypothetical protein
LMRSSATCCSRRTATRRWRTCCRCETVWAGVVRHRCVRGSVASD